MQSSMMTCTLLVFFGCATGYATADDASPTELPLVVRLSHRLIDDLADDEIEAGIPFRTSIAGGQVWGHVAGRARLTTEMDEDDDDAVFVITAQGSAHGRASGRRGGPRASVEQTDDFLLCKAGWLSHRVHVCCISRPVVLWNP